jgi:hypothetical protein
VVEDTGMEGIEDGRNKGEGVERWQKKEEEEEGSDQVIYLEISCVCVCASTHDLEESARQNLVWCFGFVYGMVLCLFATRAHKQKWVFLFYFISNFLIGLQSEKSRPCPSLVMAGFSSAFLFMDITLFPFRTKSQPPGDISVPFFKLRELSCPGTAA